MAVKVLIAPNVFWEVAKEEPVASSSGKKAVRVVAADPFIEDRHYEAIRQLREELTRIPLTSRVPPVKINRLLTTLRDSPSGTRVTAVMKQELVAPALAEAQRVSIPNDYLQHIQELIFQLPTQSGLPKNVAEDKLLAIAVQVRRGKTGEVNMETALRAIDAILNLKEGDGAKETK